MAFIRKEVAVGILISLATATYGQPVGEGYAVRTRDGGRKTLGDRKDRPSSPGPKGGKDTANGVDVASIISEFVPTGTTRSSSTVELTTSDVGSTAISSVSFSPPPPPSSTADSISSSQSKHSISFTQSANGQSTYTSSLSVTSAVMTSATTTSSLTSSSGILAPSATPTDPTAPQGPSQRSTIIAVSTTFAVVVLFIAILSIVLYRRRIICCPTDPTKRVSSPDDDEIATWRKSSQSGADNPKDSMSPEKGDAIAFTPPGKDTKYGARHAQTPSSHANTNPASAWTFPSNTTAVASDPSSAPPYVVARAPNSRAGLTDAAIPGADPYVLATAPTATTSTPATTTSTTTPKRQSSRLIKCRSASQSQLFPHSRHGHTKSQGNASILGAGGGGGGGPPGSKSRASSVSTSASAFDSANDTWYDPEDAVVQRVLEKLTRDKQTSQQQPHQKYTAASAAAAAAASSSNPSSSSSSPPIRPPSFTAGSWHHHDRQHSSGGAAASNTASTNTNEPPGRKSPLSRKTTTRAWSAPNTPPLPPLKTGFGRGSGGSNADLRPSSEFELGGLSPPPAPRTRDWARTP